MHLDHLHIGQKDKEQFSIIDWVPKTLMIGYTLSSEKKIWRQTKPWIRLWMDLVVSAILMRDENAQNNATWLVC